MFDNGPVTAALLKVGGSGFEASLSQTVSFAFPIQCVEEVGDLDEIIDNC